MNIPLTKLCIGEEEKKAVCDVLDSGWLTQGPKVAQFEQDICAFTGARYAVACSSCTTALHLALMAVGVKHGDFVTVPAFTFTATANAVEHCGAIPRFEDIGDGFAVGKQYPHKASVVAQLFGQGCKMDEVLAFAEANMTLVIEDAACGMGAFYKGKHAGTMGDVGCFSFHPRKSIATGEGGMLVTNNAGIANIARCLRDQGVLQDSYSRHVGKNTLMLDYVTLGYNYRLTDLQAAVGIEQLKKLPGIVKARKAQAALYDDMFSGVGWIKPPHVVEGWDHSYQAYVIMVPEKIRNRLMEELREKGVATRQGTHAVHWLPYYAQKYHLKPDDFPNALKADRCSIALPIFLAMTPEEQDYIIDNVIRIGKQLL